MALGSPTMRRRALARELARLREERGMSVKDVTAALEWDPSKLYRVEAMQRGIIIRDVRKLLDLYGVTDEAQREALFELSRQSKRRGWWQEHGDVLAGYYANLIGLEAEAAEIRAYEQEAVPGLLQTEAYARAVIRVSGIAGTPEGVERLVRIRMSRQDILDGDDPPQLRVVINEGAVRRLVGGRAVMSEQLRRLVSDRDRPNVRIQVLPFSAGEHPAMTESFEVLSFAAEGERGVVNVEGMSSALFLETPAELRQYGWAFDALAASALGPRESGDMLITLARELDDGEE